MLSFNLGVLRNFYRMSFIYVEIFVLKQLSLFVKLIMESSFWNNANPGSVYPGWRPQQGFSFIQPFNRPLRSQKPPIQIAHRQAAASYWKDGAGREVGSACRMWVGWGMHTEHWTLNRAGAAPPCCAVLSGAACCLLPAASWSSCWRQGSAELPCARTSLIVCAVNALVSLLFFKMILSISERSHLVCNSCVFTLFSKSCWNSLIFVCW